MSLLTILLLAFFAAAVVLLLGALASLYRYLMRRRLFPQLPRLWKPDWRRFLIMSGGLIVALIGFLALSFMTGPEPPAPPQAESPFETRTADNRAAGHEERVLPPAPSAPEPAPAAPAQPAENAGTAAPAQPQGQAEAQASQAADQPSEPAPAKQPEPAPAEPAAQEPTTPQPASTQAAAAEPAPEPAAVQSDAAAQADKPTEPKATPRTAAKDEAKAAAKEPAEPAEPAQAAKPEPEPPAKPKVEPVPLPKPSRQAGKWAVCASSHKNKEVAAKEARAMIAKGMSAQVITVELKKKGTWHRVCVGAFSDAKAAMRQAKAWKNEGLIPAGAFPARLP